MQVVIVPCGVSASSQHLITECEKLEAELLSDPELRVKGDYRENYSPGWKFAHWEQKGVPLRLELGPKDIEKNQITLVRRDTGQKLTTTRATAVSFIKNLLEEIQSSMFKK